MKKFRYLIDWRSFVINEPTDERRRRKRSDFIEWNRRSFNLMSHVFVQETVRLHCAAEFNCKTKVRAWANERTERTNFTSEAIKHSEKCSILCVFLSPFSFLFGMEPVRVLFAFSRACTRVHTQRFSIANFTNTISTAIGQTRQSKKSKWFFVLRTRKLCAETFIES